MENKRKQNQSQKKLPINGIEDVEFSMELADEEDMEALERMEQADRRQDSEYE
ncbi:YfhD family protein [Paenibacillus camelliae]|uniref:YfhD family protein n=1 Tax=Paenibacillus camelliae TaxID=512410 RepID=UPI00203F05DB|nr:YfhD family protein [Paenibacillus camelliae]MCM3631819.1 YfhD family protein [Paenibacillus camelliae]